MPISQLLMLLAGNEGYVAIANWQDNSGIEDGYILERSLDQLIWTEVLRTNANATATSDKDIPIGEAHVYYRVAAFNAKGTSAWTNIVDVPTDNL